LKQSPLKLLFKSQVFLTPVMEGEKKLCEIFNNLRMSIGKLFQMSMKKIDFVKNL